CCWPRVCRCCCSATDGRKLAAAGGTSPPAALRRRVEISTFLRPDARLRSASPQGATPEACGCGGIGRRAALRSLWANPRGSSSLLNRTTSLLSELVEKRQQPVEFAPAEVARRALRDTRGHPLCLVEERPSGRGQRNLQPAPVGGGGHGLDQTLPQEPLHPALRRRGIHRHEPPEVVLGQRSLVAELGEN